MIDLGLHSDAILSGLLLGGFYAAVLHGVSLEAPPCETWRWMDDGTT